MPTPDEDLFHRLLALDHSRQPPWGPLHAVAVACHLLQQTPGPIPADDPRLEMLRAFLAGGEPALAALAGRRRARNNHRAGSASPIPAPQAPLLARPESGFATSIADVALDGTFPAEGYEERVRRWAADTLDAWTAS